ncbi:MAG: hypothetical protein KAY32_08785 [Candidatus Eisenbacteria sp.]|nr:hypothetical protein [Candidatus Eisenbacteria bacterium]
MRRTLQLGVSGLLLLLMIAGITGCPFSPDSGNGDDPPPDLFKARTSPENLLENLKMAYRERVVAEYESLLAMDFTFLLSAEDAAEPGMPESWGRQDEIGIHTNMFDSDRVQDLSLSFDSGDRVFDPTDGLWTITITNVRLRLYGETPGNEGEGPEEYKVDSGTSKFWFRENDWTEPGTSNKIWTIVKWEDNPI